jgi:hypothetical protein
MKYPNGRKIDQMCIKYTDIFHCKNLQKLLKFGFLVWKYTLWQPCIATLKKSEIFW